MNEKFISCLAIMFVMATIYKAIVEYYAELERQKKERLENQRRMVREYKLIFRSIDLCFRLANIMMLEQRLNNFTNVSRHFLSKATHDKMCTRLRKVLADKEKEILEMERDLSQFFFDQAS